MSIHNNLRQFRLKNKLTQEQVAHKIGITRQALSSYESGRTRPNIDMLVRLSEVYGTDLDGIIYGHNRALKSMVRIKVTAVAVAVLLTTLTAVSSAFLWSANRFFAIGEGQLSAEEMVVFAFRQRLTEAWKTADEVTLTISLFGFALLLIFLVTGKCVIPLKVKVIYVTGLSVALLAMATLFGATDSMFTLTDYIITPIFVIARMILFFAIDLTAELVQKRSRHTSQ